MKHFDEMKQRSPKSVAEEQAMPKSQKATELLDLLPSTPSDGFYEQQIKQSLEKKKKKCLHIEGYLKVATRQAEENHGLCQKRAENVYETAVQQAEEAFKLAQQHAESVRDTTLQQARADYQATLAREDSVRNRKIALEEKEPLERVAAVLELLEAEKNV